LRFCCPESPEKAVILVGDMAELETKRKQLMESKYTNLAEAPTLRGGPFLSFDVALEEKGRARLLGEKKEKWVDVFRGAAEKGGEGIEKII